MSDPEQIPNTDSQPSLAAIRDRFAAQVLDSVICFLLFWYIGIAVANYYGGIGISAEGFELHGKPAFVTIAFFTLGAFLYFFLLEWLAGATIGKLLCGIKVRTIEGTRCGVMDALVRNFLRPVDFLVFYLVGLVLILTSTKRQRLGDRVAGTIVIKVRPAKGVEEKVTEALPFVGWEQRTQATIIDFIFLGIFALFYLFATKSISTAGGLSFHLRGFPFFILLLLLLAYYVGMEGILGATIGKIFAKLRIVYLEGNPCDFTAATIRTVLRPVDFMIGYVLAFLLVKFTKNRQRLGDLVAGTSVVKAEHANHVRVWVTSVWVLVIVALGIYPIVSGTVGKLVTISSMKQQVTPGTETAKQERLTALTTGDLKIVKFEFLQEKGGPVRPEASYRPGDKVYTSYDVAGFTTDPTGKLRLIFTAVSLDPAELPLLAPLQFEMNQAASKGDTVNAYFNFDLPLYAQSGKCSIKIKIHDAIKNTDTEFTQAFNVEAAPITPITRLEFRDCQLSMSKDGPPADPAVIPAGGTVYSSCKAAGMQFREDQPNVQISLQVIGPRGQVVLDKPDFMQINDSYPYHPDTFFEKISAWVTLPSDAVKGKYTWKYLMNDQIANTTANYETKFEVK